ncbi:MAG: hypothetical protein ABJF04_06075 [Reichenbachiella sp.]|uniref:hypothetical protein n=1 Tax=Reichenbachiella sp. TaxID=2184521 RepID=UPI003265CF85
MNCKTILFLLYLGWSSNSFAQIKTTVSSNNRWWNDISQTGKSYQSRKKEIRDSLKNIRRLDRYYEKKTDSLFKASHLAHRNKVPNYVADSTLSYRSPLQDEYAYYEALYLNKDTGSQWRADTLVPYPNQSLPKLSLESIENSDLFSSQIRELDAFNAQRDLITGQQNQIDGYKTQAASGQEQMEGVSASLSSAKPAIGRNSILKLAKVQTVAQNASLNRVENTIKNYKKKYESLGSIEDIGNVKTRGSMAALPFKRRLKVGGSLQLSHDQYLNIDFTPSIAYRWTRRLSTGLGFAYRAEFGNGKEWYNSLDSKTYGGRLFTEYGLFKSFYAHAESETMVSKKSEVVQSSSQTTWGLMAGVGKTFSLTGNLLGNLLLQYNFTYDDTSQIYSSPWVLRLGFEIQNLEKIFPTHKKGSTHE